MKKICFKLSAFLLVFILCLVNVQFVAGASTVLSASSFISNKTNLKHIDATINYYINKNDEVISVLNSGKCLVLVFEGGSDNSDNSMYSITSNKRVAAVCIVVKMDMISKKPYIAFSSENCSSLPDHPLAYGKYEHAYGPSYGTATLKDGIYDIYTVNHSSEGGYAGFNVRKNSSSYVPAVYMKKDGTYDELDANGINIHTRYSDGVSREIKPWSAGCILVGSSRIYSEYNRFIEIAYPQNVRLSDTLYNGNRIKYSSATGVHSGMLIIDRILYMDEMKELYKNHDAVNTIVSYSVQANEVISHTCPTDTINLNTKNYHTSDSGVLGACKECGEAYNWQSTFSKNEQKMYLTPDNKNHKAIVRKAPYKDAKCLSDEQVLKHINVVGTVTNAYNNTWYAVRYFYEDEKCCYDIAYIHSDHMEKYSLYPYDYHLGDTNKYEIEVFAPTYYSPNTITTKHTHDYTYNNGQCYCGEIQAVQQKSTLNINLTVYPTSIRQGSPFSLSGTVSSNYTIKKVSGYIKQDDTVYDSSEDKPNSKNLNVKTANLNNSLLFGKLSPGNYTLCVEAIDASGQVVRINKNFNVSVESKAESTLRINLEKYPVSLNIRSSFNIQGNISSNYPISRVKGYIYSSDGSVLQSTTDTPNSKYMEIRPANLNQRLTFGKLSSGDYIMKIEAVDTSGKVVTATKNFTVNGTSSTQSILRNGSSGSAVTELQKNLNQIMSAGLTVDGIFGNDTEKAVKAFQSRYGLTVDGIAGQDTLSKIKEILTASTTPNVPAETQKAITNPNQILSIGSSGSAVKELQTALNTIMNAGLTVDGIFGNGTQRAVNNFQSKYGLSIDGIAGPNTLNKINDILK